MDCRSAMYCKHARVAGIGINSRTESPGTGVRGEDQKKLRPQKRPRDVPEIVCVAQKTIRVNPCIMRHKASRRKNPVLRGATDAGQDGSRLQLVGHMQHEGLLATTT